MGRSGARDSRDRNDHALTVASVASRRAGPAMAQVPYVSEASHPGSPPAAYSPGIGS
jgi:hypothetical protein